MRNLVLSSVATLALLASTAAFAGSTTSVVAAGDVSAATTASVQLVGTTDLSEAGTECQKFADAYSANYGHFSFQSHNMSTFGWCFGKVLSTESGKPVTL